MADETSTDATGQSYPDKEADQLRTVISDTYVFVSSRKITETVSQYTFDRYIDEAKRRIKDDRVLRAAGGASVGTRPSQLAMLQKLQDDFAKGYDKAKELAEKADKEDEASTA